MYRQWLLFISLLFSVTCVTYAQMPSSATAHMFDDLGLDEGSKVINAQDSKQAIQKALNKIFIKANVNKSTLYPGLPALITYRLYTSVEGNTVLRQPPTMVGLKSFALESKENTNEQETINDILYNTYLMYQCEIMPLNDGNITIAPLVVDCDIPFVREKDGQTSHTTFMVKSNPLNLNVKKLPNVPSGFDNLIGKPIIHASLYKDSILSGTSDTLYLSIEGTGDIAFQNLPQIAWPKDINVMEAIVSTHVIEKHYPILSVKQFKIPFYTLTSGRFTIPSISITYYDDSLKLFKTVETAKLSIVFLPTQITTKSRPPIFSASIYLWIILALIIVLIILLIKYFLKKNEPISDKKEKLFSSLIPLVDTSNTNVIKRLNHISSISNQSEFWQEMLALFQYLEMNFLILDKNDRCINLKNKIQSHAYMPITNLDSFEKNKKQIIEDLKALIDIQKVR